MPKNCNYFYHFVFGIKLVCIFVPSNNEKQVIMTIQFQSGSYLDYTIHSDRIDLDMIVSKQKGDGTSLIKELKSIAFNLGLPIELYSEPQDDTISQEDLNLFYEKNGFDLHPDDVDSSYYIWN